MSKAPPSGPRDPAEQGEIAARRAANKQLRQLGRRRKMLEGELEKNEAEILAVIRSTRPNIDMKEAAALAGIGRTTLYRWLYRNP